MGKIETLPACSIAKVKLVQIWTASRYTVFASTTGM